MDIVAHCQAIVSQHSNIILAMFAAGLAAGFTHCIYMCGPFVMAQVTAREGDGDAGKRTFLQRLSGAALIPYHLGRMTSYVFLGVIATIMSRQIIGEEWQHWASAVFLAIAGIIFFVSGMKRAPYFSMLKKSQKSNPDKRGGKICLENSNLRVLFYKVHVFTCNLLSLSGRYGAWLGSVAKPLFYKPFGWRGYILGIFLGFLPCAWVFAALMVVASSASVSGAIGAMLAFSLGTVPALLVAGAGSQVICWRFSEAVQNIACVALMINGIGLLVIAGKVFF